MIRDDLKCYHRHCKHFTGVGGSSKTEEDEVPVCTAFPKGIPEEIAYGDNEHLEPLPDQGNDIVFEKGKFEWED